ncbi:MAG: hypothetical protein RBR87_14140 [Bacteroidales bacterium]|jgi:hypothetical protein|nr:hypothetical protein [Bacteroidales bacterium]
MIKKIAFVSGALFGSISVLSVLFKLMHYQGATILLVVGLAGIALVFIPFYAKYRYDKTK